ncbi:hypothetical protein T484DRAFT_2224493 [Baffinella frigidus]|nr:hypothetical protein T484DRAFT_2224493 [Cryptophyta sp. CCMP2293]
MQQQFSRNLAAFAMAAYMVLEHNKSVAEVVALFANSKCFELSVIPYQDPTHRVCQLDYTRCLAGIIKARSLHFFSPESFDLESYRSHASARMYSISPRIVAFMGPAAKGKEHTWQKLPHGTGCVLSGAPRYIDMLLQQHAACVVRLNDEEGGYDKETFVTHGINHKDLVFDEHTFPPDKVVRAFLSTLRHEHGLVGVHSLSLSLSLLSLWCTCRRSGGCEACVLR